MTKIIAKNFNLHEFTRAARNLDKDSYFFQPLIDLISTSSKDKILEWEEEMALLSGAFTTKTQYRKVRAAHENKRIAELMVSEFSGGFDPNLPFCEIIIEAFNPILDKPKPCTGLLLHRESIGMEVKAYLNDAEYLRENLEKSKEVKVLVANELRKQVDKIYFKAEIDYAINYQPLVVNSYKIGALDNLYRALAIREKHNLVPAAYKLYYPPWKKNLKIVDAVDLMITESVKNPSTIFNLKGRDFELFLRRIFEGFGYEVQLTAATRDGGVDLICLCRKAEIPIKIAIETKRYSANQPIGVSLVRQFVGANKQWMANKQVYVTTTDYTKPALVDASTPQFVQMLELKTLPDVFRWANDFVEDQYLYNF